MPPGWAVPPINLPLALSILPLKGPRWGGGTQSPQPAGRGGGDPRSGDGGEHPYLGKRRLPGRIKPTRIQGKTGLPEEKEQIPARNPAGSPHPARSGARLQGAGRKGAAAAGEGARCPGKAPR